MQYATALIATLALGAGAAAYTPRADAGVVIGVGLPGPVVAAPGYYPYAPVVSVGFGPAWYGHRYGGSAYRGSVYYRSGWAPGWGGYRYGGHYYHGGYYRGYGRGGYHHH